MKKYITCLLLIALLGIIVFASIAQQNQNVPKTDTEDEKHKIQLQTLENEKIGLETKLAEANTKLINTDIDKLKGELRESNNDWLRAWNNWFVGIVSVIAVIIGTALWLVLKTLIEKGIEKRLDGFKESVDQLEEIKNQLKVLQKEQVVSVLERLHYFDLIHDSQYRKQTEVLSEDGLLDVFSDETHRLELRYKAAVVLADKKFVGLSSLLLEFLNSVVNSEGSRELRSNARNFVNLLGQIKTQETYQGLKTFLNRLFTENLKNKDLFLTYTAFALADISLELEIEDSISILKKVLPDLKDTHREAQALTRLVIYFDMFNETEAIKEILMRYVTDKMRGLENRCLELLEKYDPEFVREWKEKKEDANTEGEDNNESEPTE